MKKVIISGVCVFFISATLNDLHAQLYFNQYTETQSEITVRSDNKKTLAFPWAGGMNACQYSSMDFNSDGHNDLFVFERQGGRILTFLNKGNPGISEYEFVPEYAGYFPELHDWVILADYNMDGKEDIFTYSPGWAGMKVYKNVSDQEIAFELVVFPYLTSYQGGGYVNILVTYADYPGIIDIDHDGDLDILTFWGLGTFVELHKNLSMEKYGHADSLDFIRTDRCWGYFGESEESNVIYLDTCIFGENCQDQMSGNQFQPEKNRHTGSTFLLTDLNGDGLTDLLLGDVDYPGLIQLINGGTMDTAFMVSQDTNFPSNSLPVRLFSMPVASAIDVDNNGINDLLLSPFDPNPYVVENYKSSWLYLNKGDNSNPYFQFTTDEFLQGDMIDVGSGAYPVFVDYDNDGLQDLIISNYGYYDSSWYGAGLTLYSSYVSQLALYRNTGTATNPQFDLISRDFSDLSELNLTGLYTTFADLDGDQDQDMLAGHSDGSLLYFENVADPGKEMEFSKPLTNYQSMDVGDFSAPQLFDLNNDLKPDLIIGEKGGNLNYYSNIGTIANPLFNLITDSLGKVNVTDYSVSLSGYSTPHFFNNNGAVQLVVGSEQGRLFYYKNVEGNLGGEFTANDSLFIITGTDDKITNAGFRTAAAIYDLDLNGYNDLLLGNFAGGISYYSGAAPPPVFSVSDNYNPECSNVSLYPNPVSKKLNILITHPHATDKYYISMINSLGIKVFDEIVFSNMLFTLDVGALNPGMYFLKVANMSDKQSDNHNMYRKIIVNH